MVTALYPGTFDPVTRGHAHVVERALATFDHLVVGVGVNHDKRPRFTVEERIDMLRTVLPTDPRLRVIAVEGLVVDVCRRLGVDVLLRGARSAADHWAERQMAVMNARLGGAVETVVMPTMGLGFVSSSALRTVVDHGGPGGPMIHHAVEERLHRRRS